METKMEKIIGRELIAKNIRIDVALLTEFKKQFKPVGKKVDKREYSLEHPFESKIFSSYCRA